MSHATEGSPLHFFFRGSFRSLLFFPSEDFREVFFRVSGKLSAGKGVEADKKAKTTPDAGPDAGGKSVIE